MKKFYKNLWVAQLEFALKTTKKDDTSSLLMATIRLMDLIEDTDFNDTLEAWIGFKDDDSIIDIQLRFHKSLRQTDCLGNANMTFYHLLNITKINVEFTTFLKFILKELKPLLNCIEKNPRRNFDTDKELSKYIADHMKYWSIANDM